MKTLILPFIFFICTNLYAQDKLPIFGKIEKEELEMKSCSFEPDAEAMVLFDFGDSYYNISPTSVGIEAKYRKRIKIFKESAKDRADIKISYYSYRGFEDIQSIEAVAYNLDEQGNIVATKLEKKMIFDKKINDRYSQISFAIPTIKAGTVIEYKYISWKKNTISDIEDWSFQEDIPVKYSAYNVHIPQYFDFTYNIIRRQDVEIKKANDIEAGYWFIMRNIPALKQEPFMAARKDYVQRIDFQLSAIRPPGQNEINYRTTWNKLAEELDGYEWFGPQLRKNVPETAKPIAALLEGSSDIDKKIEAIYSFVQSQMNWNNQEAIGSWDGIKKAWDKKNGSTADINLLLVNLLKENGVTAYPILVSTRENGIVNTLYPFLGQFDNVYAYAEGNTKKYILNAADKYNPASLYPYDVQMTSGLVLRRNSYEWVDIFDKESKLKHDVSVFINIDNNLKATGTATIRSFEYGKNIRLERQRSNKLKDMLLDDAGMELTIDSINYKNGEVNNHPFQQKVFFTAVYPQDNDYVFIPYNIFLGLKKNPFIAEKRQSAIDFGYQQSYTIVGTIIAPDGYEVSEIPKNTRMILPDTSIAATRLIQVQENIINYKLNVEFKRAFFERDEYDDVKEVYKKLYGLLNEQIILKKKK